MFLSLLHNVGEEKEAQGDSMVDQQDVEVSADGLDVDSGIQTMQVEAHLCHVEPVQGWLQLCVATPCWIAATITQTTTNQEQHNSIY